MKLTGLLPPLTSSVDVKPERHEGGWRSVGHIWLAPLTSQKWLIYSFQSPLDKASVLRAL